MRGALIASFYAVHSGSELDLLMETRGRRIAVEFKRADAPRATRSMHQAMADTGADELWVFFPPSAFLIQSSVNLVPDDRVVASGPR